MLNRIVRSGNTSASSRNGSTHGFSKRRFGSSTTLSSSCAFRLIMPTSFHDEIQFHYEDAGSGLPFIFQHGLGADVTQPFALFQPPPGSHLLAFDGRSHG